MPVRVCGQYQMLSQDVWRSRTSQLTRTQDCAMCWEMFKDTWAFTAFCLHSTERNAWAKANGSSRRGTNRVRQVVWYSILHRCQVLKSFFPMSDGAA